MVWAPPLAFLFSLQRWIFSDTRRLAFSMRELAVLVVFALALAVPRDFSTFCSRVRLAHLEASLPCQMPLNFSDHLLALHTFLLVRALV